MKPARSSLFVPGNKPAWMEKAVKYGADVLILDLEDSVPNQEKIAARAMVKEALGFLKKQIGSQKDESKFFYVIGKYAFQAIENIYSGKKITPELFKSKYLFNKIDKYISDLGLYS